MSLPPFSQSLVRWPAPIKTINHFKLLRSPFTHRNYNPNWQQGTLYSPLLIISRVVSSLLGFRTALSKRPINRLACSTQKNHKITCKLEKSRKSLRNGKRVLMSQLRQASTHSLTHRWTQTTGPKWSPWRTFIWLKLYSMIKPISSQSLHSCKRSNHRLQKQRGTFTKLIRERRMEAAHSVEIVWIAYLKHFSLRNVIRCLQSIRSNWWRIIVPQCIFWARLWGTVRSHLASRKFSPWYKQVLTIETSTHTEAPN